MHNGHFVVIDNKYKFPIVFFDFQKRIVNYINKQFEKKSVSFDKCQIMILENFHKMSADVEFEPNKE